MTDLDPVAPPKRRPRRKMLNFLLAPKPQFQMAAVIFGVGFVSISLLFGLMLYRVHDLIGSLAEMSTNPAETLAATSWTGSILLITYLSLLVAFLFSAILLSLAITHRYHGPMVPIHRHIKRLIEGNYEEKVYLRKNDQFKEVADDLNVLTDRLKAGQATKRN